MPQSRFEFQFESIYQSVMDIIYDELFWNVIGMTTLICPCGSGQRYIVCCGPYITGKTTALTAEALMRSRYTAYVLCDSEYVLKTWHPDTRPAEFEMEASLKWLGLKVVATSSGNQGDTEGMVEFVARSKFNGRAHRHHEKSRFSILKGQWLYVDGECTDK